MNSREMTQQEGEAYFESLLQQVKDYAPDEIVAVARSGFSYAAWIAQELDLPLGAYWPNTGTFVSQGKKIVFIDDNTIKGTTYKQIKQFMLTQPNTQWKFGVFFADWQTPKKIRDRIFIGARLPYFAQGGYYGRRFSQAHKDTFEITPFTKFREMLG